MNIKTKEQAKQFWKDLDNDSKVLLLSNKPQLAYPWRRLEKAIIDEYGTIEPYSDRSVHDHFSVRAEHSNGKWLTEVSLTFQDGLDLYNKEFATRKEAEDYLDSVLVKDFNVVLS